MINAKHFYGICLSYHQQINQQETKTDSEGIGQKFNCRVEGVGVRMKRKNESEMIAFVLALVLSTISSSSVNGSIEMKTNGQWKEKKRDEIKMK